MENGNVLQLCHLWGPDIGPGRIRVEGAPNPTHFALLPFPKNTAAFQLFQETKQKMQNFRCSNNQLFNFHQRKKKDNIFHFGIRINSVNPTTKNEMKNISCFFLRHVN